MKNSRMFVSKEKNDKELMNVINNIFKKLLLKADKLPASINHIKWAMIDDKINRSGIGKHYCNNNQLLWLVYLSENSIFDRLKLN